MKPCPNLLPGLIHRSFGATRTGSHNVCVRADAFPVYESDKRTNVYDYTPLRGLATTGAVVSPSSRLFRSSVTNLKTRPFSTSACARVSLDDSDDFDDVDDAEEYGQFRFPVEMSRDLEDLIRKRKRGGVKPKITSPVEVLRAREREAREIQAAELRREIQKLGLQLSSVTSAIGKVESGCVAVKRSIARRKKIQEVVKKTRAVAPKIRKFASQYLVLKYSGFDAEIAKCATVNRLFRDEYLRIKYENFESIVSEGHKSIRKLKHKLWKLKHDVLFSSVELWMEKTSKLVRELEEQFIGPRESARKNISGVLALASRAQRDYRELKIRMHPASFGLLQVKNMLVDLGRLFKPSDPRRAFYFERAADAGFLMSDFEYCTHQFRAAFLRRRIEEGPCADAWGLWFVRDLVHRGDLPVSRVAKMGLTALASRQAPKPSPKNTFPLDKALHEHYIPKHQKLPAHSPDLDIIWRQLDVLAPFELTFTFTAMLEHEIRYLIGTLRKRHPAWEKLDEVALARQRDIFKEWVLRYNDSCAAIREEYSLFQNINWIRLRLENKLHALGVPDWNRKLGFFKVRKPLSQDLKLFDQWASDINTRSYNRLIIKAAIYADPKFWHIVHAKYWKNPAKEKPPKGSSIPDLGSVKEEPNNRRLHASRASSSTSPHFQRAARPRKGLRVSRASKKERFKESYNAGVRKRDKHARPKDYKVGGGISPRRTSSRKPWGGPHRGKHGTEAPKAAAKTSQAKSLKKNQKDRLMVEGMPPSSERKPGKPGKSGEPPAKPRRSWWPWSGAWNRRSFSTQSCSTHIQKSSAFHGFGGPKRYVWLRSITRAREEGNGLEMSETAPSGGESVEVTAQQSCRMPAPSVSQTPTASFWSPDLLKGPGSKRIVTHYCRSLERTEKVAQYFLESEVIGLDLEWKILASDQDSIQDNVSLIQIANEERIALFQLALFRPGKTVEDFVAPSLRRLLESPEITKVGVTIKADCTRLRKHLGINVRALFELSHLHKLVKYCQSNPKLINKQAVNLSKQVEEHLGLPLDKGEDVRCSDWHRPLNSRQLKYAATDPYACLCLFNVMEAKRKAIVPTPPRPAHAELDLPILLAPEVVVDVQEKVEVTTITTSQVDAVSEHA